MIAPHTKGSTLSIQVKTRARRSTIRVSQDSLFCHVSVKAAPIHGQANREVVKLLAKRLGISAGRVKIITGFKSPSKVLLIEGIEPSKLQSALRKVTS